MGQIGVVLIVALLSILKFEECSSRALLKTKRSANYDTFVPNPHAKYDYHIRHRRGVNDNIQQSRRYITTAPSVTIRVPLRGPQYVTSIGIDTKPSKSNDEQQPVDTVTSTSVSVQPCDGEQDTECQEADSITDTITIFRETIETVNSNDNAGDIPSSVGAESESTADTVTIITEIETLTETVAVASGDDAAAVAVAAATSGDTTASSASGAASGADASVSILSVSDTVIKTTETETLAASEATAGGGDDATAQSEASTYTSGSDVDTAASASSSANGVDAFSKSAIVTDTVTKVTEEESLSGTMATSEGENAAVSLGSVTDESSATSAAVVGDNTEIDEETDSIVYTPEQTETESVAFAEAKAGATSGTEDVENATTNTEPLENPTVNTEVTIEQPPTDVSEVEATAD